MDALRLSLAAVAAVSAGVVNAQDAGQQPRLGAVELYESNSFELNRSAGTMTFDGFRISGDNWSLVADRAIANADELDFESGQWRFEGNINLRLDTASLVADDAFFAFRDKRVVMAELNGSPVAFQDQGTPERDAVHGSAMTLRYDDAAGTFELLGSVSLIVGPYRTTGCDLVYYLGEEEFTTGSTQCNERFRTVIVPEESAEATAE